MIISLLNINFPKTISEFYKFNQVGDKYKELYKSVKEVFMNFS